MTRRRDLLKLLGAGALAICAVILLRESLLARPRTVEPDRQRQPSAPPPRRTPLLQSLRQPGEPPPDLAWRPASEAERQAVAAVIQSQLESFRTDDYRRGRERLSSVMKRGIPEPEGLRRMVRTLYPELAHFHSIQYGRARATRSGTRVEILVTVTGQDGGVAETAYDMIREGSTWLVASITGGISHGPPPDTA
jgi:hypothetical protein